jgi:outer membrane lipoprotein SlyB
MPCAITMKALCSFLLAATFVAAPAAHACEADAQVHGVRLSSICGACGVVSAVHVETRKGSPSGVGAVGGAVVGGALGHQIGGGSGRAAATLLGALGGGVTGNAIEKNVRRTTVWSTTVTFRDGSMHKYEHTSDPDLDEGDVVTIEDGLPVKHPG